MIPAAFEYEQATSVDEALDLLGRFGSDSKVLAGGHSLIPLLKFRLAAPSALVDIGRISELDYVRDGGDHVAIGALVRHRRLASDPVVREQCGLVAQAAAAIGDVQVRERGTIGGSLAHADPAADLPAVLVALGATIVVRGPQGERTVPAGQFFEYFLTTALAEGELLTEIRVPKLGDGWAWRYERFVKRAIDWPIVAVAVAVRANGDGATEARIGLANMGATPLRAAAVESALAGGADAAAAAEHIAEGTDPPNDLNATPDYRRQLARVLTRRALTHLTAH